MENKKSICSTADYKLIIRHNFDRHERGIRTAYQVIESDGNVAGLFGSLNEAEAFLNMLNQLNYHYK